MNRFQPTISINKVSDVLLNAMALLESPDRWTTGTYARNHRDIPTHTSNEDACKFCMVGALEVFASHQNHTYGRSRAQVLDVVQEETQKLSVPGFNDAHTTKHAQVLQVMTAAAFYALADEG